MSLTEPTAELDAAKVAKRKAWMLVVRIVLTVIVIAAVYWSFKRGLIEIDQEGFDLRDVDLGWVGVACVCYMMGNVCAWYYWQLVLRSMHQQVTWKSSFQAYCIGQLGKYIPGKAAVLIMRVGMLRGERVSFAVATASIFVETLTMMAVGASCAALILLVTRRDNPMLIWLSVGLMLAAGLPTLPPLFRQVISRMRVVRLSSEASREIRALNWRVIGSGWAISLGTWLSFGLSLLCVLRAIPGTQPTLADLPLTTACIGLATVAGFVSFLPGGLGAREAVLIPLLAQYGSGTAMIAAILLRLAWLVTESLLATILYGWQTYDKYQPRNSP
jgi:glycosyltransferase 2 family protein